MSLDETQTQETTGNGVPCTHLALFLASLTPASDATRQLAHARAIERWGDTYAARLKLKQDRRESGWPARVHDAFLCDDREAQEWLYDRITEAEARAVAWQHRFSMFVHIRGCMASDEEIKTAWHEFQQWGARRLPPLPVSHVVLPRPQRPVGHRIVDDRRWPYDVQWRKMEPADFVEDFAGWVLDLYSDGELELLRARRDVLRAVPGDVTRDDAAATVARLEAQQSALWLVYLSAADDASGTMMDFDDASTLEWWERFLTMEPDRAADWRECGFSVADLRTAFDVEDEEDHGTG